MLNNISLLLFSQLFFQVEARIAKLEEDKKALEQQLAREREQKIQWESKYAQLQALLNSKLVQQMVVCSKDDVLILECISQLRKLFFLLQQYSHY